jgi:hypothetical protein
LHWPDLDIDLAVESIDHPERYPLISQSWPNNSPDCVKTQFFRNGPQ